jgi:hypothetical protein
MLEEALQFSKDMVAARMRDNHGKRDLEKEERDLNIIEVTGLMLALKRLKKMLVTKKKILSHERH